MIDNEEEEQKACRRLVVFDFHFLWLHKKPSPPKRINIMSVLSNKRTDFYVIKQNADFTDEEGTFAPKMRI